MRPDDDLADDPYDPADELGELDPADLEDDE